MSADRLTGLRDAVPAMNCPDCDFPIAMSADYDTFPYGRSEHLCWRARNNDVCMRPAVNWRTRALEAEAALDEAYLDFAALVNERNEIERFAGAAVDRCLERRREVAGRDAAIEALTKRVAELLGELKSLRAFYGKFRYAEIESLT